MRVVYSTVAALPAVLTAPPDLVVTHGTIEDPEHYLATPRRAEVALTQLGFAYREARLLVCGHTHKPMLYRSGGVWQTPEMGTPHKIDDAGRWLLNPGAVGQARDDKPVARYVRYDALASTVVFREVAYPYWITLEKLAAARLVARVTSRPQTPLADRLEAWQTRLARWRAARISPTAP